MKHPLLILSAAAMLSFLPSCTTYVDGQVAARPGYGYRPAPGYRSYPASYRNTRYYSNNRYRYDRHDHDDDHHRRTVSYPQRKYYPNTATGVRVRSDVGLTPLQTSGYYRRW